MLLMKIPIYLDSGSYTFASSPPPKKKYGKFGTDLDVESSDKLPKASCYDSFKPYLFRDFVSIKRLGTIDARGYATQVHAIKRHSENLL